MFTAARRLPAILLAFSLLLGPWPAAAADPSNDPGAAPSVEPMADVPDGRPTIHAEMLAAPPESGATTFVEGAVPEPLLAVAASMQGVEGQVGIAALPNGLSHEVYGYLPYWALDSSLLGYLRYDLVSTIAYFAVPAQSDGSLLTSGIGWSGWTSSHMTNVINAAHGRGVGVNLTVSMMAWSGDYTAMSTLLNSGPNRARLASEIASAVRARNADGVNLDFEPVPSSLGAQYTAFVRELKAALLAAGAGSYLTVAATGGAASWVDGYDLAGLTEDGAADAIMVMGYDFSWSGSTRAGGVAPIYNPYIYDVTDAMAAYVAAVPPSKLIWGVPYYGRAWTTQDASLNSLTCKSASICPNGTAAAFGRTWAPRYVDALEAVGMHGRLWDGNGRVPWYTYSSTTYATQVQGYYDDAESLRAKYGMVEAHGMRGVGIWHLLMDVDRPELWNELARNFAQPPLIGPFRDIGSSGFIADILWLVDAGMTNGCAVERFCPTAGVTREQMASFLVRAVGLPAATHDFFSDDAGSVHEDDINRVAQAGITLGCGGIRYCPNTVVTREQMASFLARAVDLPAATGDFFSDDAGSRHQADINRLAESGITSGCGGTLYCPSGVVTREQMAAFLHRAFD